MAAIFAFKGKNHRYFSTLSCLAFMTDKLVSLLLIKGIANIENDTVFTTNLSSWGDIHYITMALISACQIPERSWQRAMGLAITSGLQTKSSAVILSCLNCMAFISRGLTWRNPTEFVELSKTLFNQNILFFSSLVFRVDVEHKKI